MREVSMRLRRKQKKLLRLGDFLHKTLKRRKIHLDMADPYICEAWNKSVGHLIAAQTHPYKFKNNTLFVKVSTSTWMQQLQFMKQDIIDKVNPAFGKNTVKNIYFSIGKIPSVSTKKGQNDIHDFERYQLKERDAKLIRKSLEPVADKELKGILKRVITKEMIRRRITEDEKFP